MKLYEKLLEIQCEVDRFVKDGENKSDKYSYVSSDTVLETVRPKMNELKLLLIPKVTGARLHQGETKSGTTRFMTEMDITFVWVDCEDGETLEVPFYAQGVDLAGEKGVGKALTYSEKYFLMKFFHVPTAKDDPDSDGSTGTGEKLQKGTQAAKENTEFYRQAIPQMLDELCEGDAEKIKQSYIAFTKNEARQYAGVDSIEKLSPAQLPLVYGTISSVYTKRKGVKFTIKTEEN